MKRQYIADYASFPMPRLRDDAYYGAFMNVARAELESLRYSFDPKTGTEYEDGHLVSRYTNPTEYDPAHYVTRKQIYECVFSRAIRSRAARLHNLAIA